VLIGPVRVADDLNLSHEIPAARASGPTRATSPDLPPPR
jgi:hypothetical protein